MFRASKISLSPHPTQYPASDFTTDLSKVVRMLQFLFCMRQRFYMWLYFVIFLVSKLSFFKSHGNAVFHVCGISRVPLFIYLGHIHIAKAKINSACILTNVFSVCVYIILYHVILLTYTECPDQTAGLDVTFFVRVFNHWLISCLWKNNAFRLICKYIYNM